MSNISIFMNNNESFLSSGDNGSNISMNGLTSQNPNILTDPLIPLILTNMNPLFPKTTKEKLQLMLIHLDKRHILIILINNSIDSFLSFAFIKYTIFKLSDILQNLVQISVIRLDICINYNHSLRCH